MAVELLGMIVRYVIAASIAWLAAHQVVPAADTGRVTTALLDYAPYITGFVLMVAWAVWVKVKARIKFLTALEAPAGTTEHQVDKRIANGAGATLKS